MLDFSSIKIGDTRELEHKICPEDIQKFADLTGDSNPLHLDEKFARRTNFRKPVVYGMLSASFVSTVIGTLMPGPGALWLSQTLNFLRQAYVGDTIRVIARVKQKSPATRILVLETVILNQNQEELITGEAKVRLLEPAKEDNLMKKKENKVALITGASRGIGAAVARKLAGESYKVVVNYLQNKAKALELVKELKSSGAQALAIQADISDKAQVQRMFSEAESAFGPVQALVLNASGAIKIKPFQDVSWEMVQAHLDVQAKGAFNCIQAALGGMLSLGSGSIVVIGSIAADSVPPAQQSAYVIAKAALNALAKSVAVEYGPKNIRVNIVSPGMTQTELIADLPEKAKELTRMQTPLRALASPEDIANVASFLLGPLSAHVTGENIRVCGGAVML